jgi:hypothetical protein
VASIQLANIFMSWLAFVFREESGRQWDARVVTAALDCCMELASIRDRSATSPISRYLGHHRSQTARLFDHFCLIGPIQAH